MTPQEIFNRSYQGIMAQGGFSFRRRGESAVRCLYAGPDGKGCAVGVLLSRDIAEAWDNLPCSGIRNIIRDQFPGVEPWMEKNKDLLANLQHIHDLCAQDKCDLVAYKAGMRALAAEFGLEMPQ